MNFVKMHGIGNDYIFIDCTKKTIDDPKSISKKLSNRNFGIGSDGLILICKSDIADFKMRIFNSDGTEAEMCGNGIRCVGKYIHDYKLSNKDVLNIETLAGIKRIKLNIENDKVISIKVDMGKPIIEEKINLIINDKMFELIPVSMGNPHVVTIVDDLDNFDVAKYGKLISENNIFPNKTNVEFIKICDKSNINMRVYERGVGETLACGTGSCAAVAACYKYNLTDKCVNVNLKGGILKIDYDDNIYMTGNATTVFTGTYLGGNNGEY